MPEEPKKEADFRTSWKNVDGKVEDAALPPVEAPGSSMELRIDPEIEQKFLFRMRQATYVMRECYAASLQVVEQNIPSGMAMMNPNAAEGMRQQLASMIVGKMFESMQDMIPKITFQLVMVAEKE